MEGARQEIVLEKEEEEEDLFLGHRNCLQARQGALTRHRRFGIAKEGGARR